MMIGSGTPSSQSSAPLPKPMISSIVAEERRTMNAKVPMVRSGGNHRLFWRCSGFEATGFLPRLPEARRPGKVLQHWARASFGTHGCQLGPQRQAVAIECNAPFPTWDAPDKARVADAYQHGWHRGGFPGDDVPPQWREPITPSKEAGHRKGCPASNSLFSGAATHLGMADLTGQLWPSVHARRSIWARPVTRRHARRCAAVRLTSR